MFRRRKKAEKSQESTEESSIGRKWTFRKKGLEKKSASSLSLNIEVQTDRNHQRSATEPSKIDLSAQKINTERVPSAIEAVKKSFQRHFPRLYFTGEVVIKSFTCALEKDIIMQGKIYLTPRYACFYSNVFNRNYILEIPYDHVSKVEKRNTMGMIPNAISIWVEDEVHFFLSFTKRDLAFDLMTEFWENQKISDQDYCNLEASFKEIKSPLSDRRLFLLNNDSVKNLLVNSNEELKIAQTYSPIMENMNGFPDSAVSSNIPDSIIGTPNNIMSDAVAANGHLSFVEASSKRLGHSPRGSLSFSNGSSFGPAIPLNWELLEISLNVDFLNVFSQLFSDSWSAWSHIHKICGTNGLFVGNWKQDVNSWSRNLIYSPNIKMPQSASTVLFMEKQVLKKFNTYVKLESTIRLQNSSYTDVVLIKIHYASAMKLLNKSRLTISAQVDYLKKNNNSKGYIESAVFDWLIQFHSCFVSYIKEKFNSDTEQEPINSSQIPESKTSKTSIEENSHVSLIPPNNLRKDYRFWIALGIILALLFAISIKLRLQNEFRLDDNLSDQLMKAKRKLFEQELHIADLWTKLKAHMDERNQDPIIL